MQLCLFDVVASHWSKSPENIKFNLNLIMNFSLFIKFWRCNNWKIFHIQFAILSNTIWINLFKIEILMKYMKIFSLGPFYRMGRVKLDYVTMWLWLWSSLQRWSLFLLVGFTDTYNHTYYESFWWKLFKNHKRTQIQRRRQWQRQRQRQIHRQSAWKTQHMLYFWNPDDLLIPNLMIDTSPRSSCSR